MFQSASKKLDPCDLIVESLPVFSSGALSISSLSRDALVISDQPNIIFEPIFLYVVTLRVALFS